MDWTCIIVVERGWFASESAALLRALRAARRRAAGPAARTVFYTRGSASRTTFLLPPGAARPPGRVMRRFDARACEQAPDLRRYAPLHL